MKNVELKINSHSCSHPNPDNSGEGSAQLINLAEIPCLPQAGSLPLRMTGLEFLIRKAI